MNPSDEGNKLKEKTSAGAPLSSARLRDRMREQPAPEGKPPLSLGRQIRRLFKLFRQRRALAVVAVLLLAAIGIALLTPAGRDLLGTAARPTATPPATALPGPTQGKPGDGTVLFLENVGQFAEAVRFQARSGERTLWLTEDGLWVTVLAQAGTSAKDEMASMLPTTPGTGVNLKLSFAGANSHPRLEPFNRLSTRVTYLTGYDSAHWRTDVPVWGGVRYVDIYPGVDLEITGEKGQWVWQLVSHNPQFDLSGVRLQVGGAEAMTLEASAALGGAPQLYLATAAGAVRLPLLTADQPGSPSVGEGHSVANPFVSPLSPPPLQQIAGVPANPSDLLYSTFLGGSDDDWGYAMAVDGAGNAYIAGEVKSTDFITATGAFSATGRAVQSDALVIKLSADGARLEYVAFLGGSLNDWANSIVVDDAGHVYVAGSTGSGDFPVTQDAYDTTCGTDGNCDAAYPGLPGYDVFVAKLNPTGSGLLYSTFLGGSSFENGSSIAVDAAGNAYVTGNTWSSDFPTTAAAYQTTHGGASDAFVAKLNAAGSALVYSTLLGGSGSDFGLAIAEEAGHAYVTGRTLSANFPTTSDAYDGAYADDDAFVVKLGLDGASLAYATFLGGSGSDQGRAIAVDGSGNLYVTGNTSADFFVTSGAFDVTHNGASDVFVAKFRSGGSTLQYATFLGGSDSDWGYGIAVDKSGDVYVTGSTLSADFPTRSWAFDTTHNGGSDVFAARLNPSGASLRYATFMGGGQDDHGRAIALGLSGRVYIAGYTASTDFPVTPGAFDTTFNGDEKNDAFAASLSMPIHTTFSISGQVTDSSGRPVAGASVKDHLGRATLTDANGNYLLSELVSGTYTLTLSVSGMLSEVRTVYVPPDVTDQNFVARPASTQIYLPVVLRNSP